MVSNLEENSNHESLLKFALKNGAIASELITVDQVKVADWVHWKCKYGCPHFGMFLTCPPYSPTPQQTRELLKDYKQAIIVKYDSSQDHHRCIFELEREAFLIGFYSAWGLSSGRCRLCESCVREVGSCRYPLLARPSMEACGIDVFATSRNAGFDMSVKTSSEERYQRICLLLVK
jgi:predicted metal-binding protein